MALALLADLSECLAEVFLEPSADLNGRLESLLSRDSSLPWSGPIQRMLDHPLDSESQAVEYTRLFLHSREGDVVHLFESVQTQGHLMAPEVLNPLQAIYDAADLSLKEGLPVPPDHLGLELACLGYLLGQAIDAEAAERLRLTGLAQRLLQAHLAPLTRAVTAQLPQVQAHPYYLGAADAAQALVQAATEALALR